MTQRETHTETCRHMGVFAVVMGDISNFEFDTISIFSLTISIFSILQNKYRYYNLNIDISSVVEISIEIFEKNCQSPRKNFFLGIT